MNRWMVMCFSRTSRTNQHTNTPQTPHILGWASTGWTSTHSSNPSSRSSRTLRRWTGRKPSAPRCVKRDSSFNSWGGLTLIIPDVHSTCNQPGARPPLLPARRHVGQGRRGSVVWHARRADPVLLPQRGHRAARQGPSHTVARVLRVVVYLYDRVGGSSIQSNMHAAPTGAAAGGQGAERGAGGGERGGGGGRVRGGDQHARGVYISPQGQWMSTGGAW